jgi:Arc/MetJ-type ribon-helix-helix transcriptional regulator
MKVSISARVDEALIRYLDSYRQAHAIKSRSEALEQAIKALRERELSRQYALAMAEWNASGDADVWDQTAGDGLELTRDVHEAW